MREDLEVGDGIRDVAKGRIQVQLVAEGAPNGPVGCSGGGGTRNDSRGNGLLRSAEIAEERIADGRRKRRQGWVCG